MGIIVDISYKRHLDSKLEEYIKGEPVEILLDNNLNDKIVMITNK